jgi:hypothetical protein
MKKKPMMTEKQDRAMDRKAGIKDNSPADKRMDRMQGVKQTPPKRKRGA